MCFPVLGAMVEGSGGGGPRERGLQDLVLALNSGISQPIWERYHGNNAGPHRINCSVMLYRLQEIKMGVSKVLWSMRGLEEFRDTKYFRKE